VTASFSDQCPKRGPSLTHRRDWQEKPDGSCVFCGFHVSWSVCKGYGCIANTAGDYCLNCVDLRGQHAFSHKVEGHPEVIRMCPPCEEGSD
jgi:hypothetical protein